jgi:CHASE2 domain-containing sensor protein
MALLYLLIGIIIARLFWRQLLTIASWAALLGVMALLWRAAPSLGLSSGWMLTSYGAGVAGFVVGALIALKPIINLLVESDYGRAIERARQDADRRRV